MPLDPPPFHFVVRMLRTMPGQYRTMALHAALFWSDDRLAAAEAAGDLPGLPAELVEKPKAPVLRLVPCATAGNQNNAQAPASEP
jgi:hypothetical protein